MHNSKNSYKLALAASLTIFTGACAHKLAPPTAAAPVSSYPAVSETQLTGTEGKDSSRAAGHSMPQAPGIVVHIDPLTGEILPNSAVAADAQTFEPQQFQSAPAPLPQTIEVPSPVPGGGIKVNLNRQFHQPLFATIDADGKVKLEHRPARSEPGVK